jgi:hypothetical protein
MLDKTLVGRKDPMAFLFSGAKTDYLAEWNPRTGSPRPRRGSERPSRPYRGLRKRPAPAPARRLCVPKTYVGA